MYKYLLLFTLLTVPYPKICFGILPTELVFPEHEGCDSLLGKFVNTNASIPAINYLSTNYRNLDELDYRIGNDFRTTQTRLSPGSRILDAGGAFSVYGLELARKGYNVITINAQDSYRDSFYVLADPNRARKILEQLRARDQIVQGVSLKLFGNLSEATGVSLPNCMKRIEHSAPHEPKVLLNSVYDLELAGRELAWFVTNVKSRIEKLEKSGEFERKVKLVQDELPNIASDSIDEIIDCFGAVHYSSNRLALIKEYYRVLKPGKKAHIVFNTKDTIWSAQRKKNVSLFEYLKERYPAIFSVDDKVTDTLIIHKPAA